MHKSHFSRHWACALLLCGATLPARADLFPEGVLGLRLGQTRPEAITALVKAGVTPDLDNIRCSDQVPERNRAVANRICKMPIRPGSVYLEQPVNKVSLLFQDERIVLIGLDVGSAADSFATLRAEYRARWGEASWDVPGIHIGWKEPSSQAPVEEGTYLRLYADAHNTLFVYAYQSVR